MPKWAFKTRLLQLRLSTVIFTILCLIAIIQFFSLYGTYNYAHIPEDTIQVELYKETSPDQSLKKAKHDCKYEDILTSKKSTDTWDLPKKYNVFSPQGIVNGSHVPDDCKPLFSVAIIVTYRNRQKQLDIFLPYMHNFLRRQRIHYKHFSPTPEYPHPLCSFPVSKPKDYLEKFDEKNKLYQQSFLFLYLALSRPGSAFLLKRFHFTSFSIVRPQPQNPYSLPTMTFRQSNRAGGGLEWIPKMWIYVVEQKDEKPWNKGMLYNIGAKRAIADKFPCLILHDVDLLPLDESNLYVCTQRPRHMSASIDKFRYVLTYSYLVGGVLAIRSDQYTTVNGFSNRFTGWGGEDDDFAARLDAHHLEVVRFPRDMSRYTMLVHHQEAKNSQRLRIMAENRQQRDRDGMDAVYYNSIEVKPQRLFTLITVKL